MTHVTQPMLVNAINAQDDEFVTHDVVRFLYTNYLKWTPLSRPKKCLP